MRLLYTIALYFAGYWLLYSVDWKLGLGVCLVTIAAAIQPRKGDDL